MIEKNYIITEEFANKIVAYLQKDTYEKVATMIQGLLTLRPVQISEPKPHKNKTIEPIEIIDNKNKK